MRTKIQIIKVFMFVYFYLFLCNGCNFSAKQNVKETNTPKNQQISEQDNPYKDAEIRAVVISSENNTFGYDIYLYDAILIHQPSRPGLSGNAGFATTEDAMKVAEFVIKKIHNNEMPPTITLKELEKLVILK